MLRRNLTLAKAFVAALSATLLSVLINLATNEGVTGKRWGWTIWPLILLLVVLSFLLEGQRHRRSAQLDEAAQPAADQIPEHLEHTYRDRMIVRVRSSWVTGVLGRSLHAAARAAASRHTVTSDAPLTPWNLAYLPPAIPEPAMLEPAMVEAITPDIPVIEVFDHKIGGAMLILGGAGAGKTTLLLRLARDLLDLAEADSTRPIPVLFKLASWSPSRSLNDWLVDELRKLYDVPPNLGRHWITTERVLPLLDGLDEVPSHHRARCVEAINAYRDDHGMIPLAITSRSPAYQELAARLRVQGIIRVDPPTPSQIAAYLDEVGIQLPHIRAVLDDDPSLQRLLASPLVLNIVALAYRRRSGADLLTSDTPDAWRHHLFKVYVEEMLSRDDKPATRAARWYGSADVERYLAWLARMLRRHPQGTFRLEWIQPQWLTTPAARSIATWGLTVAAAVVAAIIAGMAAGFIDGTLDPRLGLSPRQPLLGVPSWLVTAIGIGAGVGILMHSKTVQPVDELRWSWLTLRRRLPSRMPMAVLLGAIAGTIAWAQSGVPQQGAVFGMATGLLALLLYLAVGGFTGGLREDIASPNDGMRRTRRTAVLGGLPIALPFGLLTAGLYGIAASPTIGIVAGLHTTIAFWIMAGLWAGGRDYLRHLSIRALLWRARLAPWRYARFLDYAVDRLLLQRVGAGYQFMHPLLLDYFALRQDRMVYPPPAHPLATVGRRLVRTFQLIGEDAARLVRRREPGSELGWRA
jgi:NACHT domain